MAHPADERGREEPHFAPIAESKLLRSFHHAFEGIMYATRTQPNMRVHLVIAALVLAATLVLRLERFYVVATVVLVSLVLSLELVNTAVEAIVDLLTVAHHPLAKTAKDAAAGAVLIAAVGAAIAGYLIFYQGIISGGARVFAAVAAGAGEPRADRAGNRRDRHDLRQSVGRARLAASGRRGLRSRCHRLRCGDDARVFLSEAAWRHLGVYCRVPGRPKPRRSPHSNAFEVFWGAALGTLFALAIYVLVRPHVVL